MRHLILLVALALVLPACDSAGDTGPDALLGTWNTQSGTSETFITVSQSQSLRDPFSPGTGMVTVSGSISGTLRYGFASIDPSSTRVTLTDAPLTNGNVLVGLTVTVTPTGQRLVAGTAADRSFRLDAAQAPLPATIGPDGVVIAQTTLPEVGGNGSVTVGGQLTFARIAAAAGQDVRLMSSAFTRADASRLSVTFDADGTYRQVNQDLSASTGTWADVGSGQVRIRIGANTPVTFMYTVRGSALTLVANEVTTGADLASAAEQFTALYGAVPGTLTGLRSASTTVFARGSGSAQPASQPVAARPSPSTASSVAAFPFLRP